MRRVNESAGRQVLSGVVPLGATGSPTSWATDLSGFLVGGDPKPEWGCRVCTRSHRDESASPVMSRMQSLARDGVRSVFVPDGPSMRRSLSDLGWGGASERGGVLEAAPVLGPPQGVRDSLRRLGVVSEVRSVLFRRR